MDVLGLNNSIIVSLTGAALTAYMCNSIPILHKFQQEKRETKVISFMGTTTPSYAPPAEISGLRKIVNLVGYQVKLENIPHFASGKNSTDDFCIFCGCFLTLVGIEGEVPSCGSCSARQVMRDNVTVIRDDHAIIAPFEGDNDRMMRFKLVVNQYCCRQTAIIDDKVMEKIKASLRLYRLMDNEEATSTLTKGHVAKVLKEIGLTRHNENIHLIFVRLTGRPPSDLSSIEERLYDDFRQVSDTFDKLYVENRRKNFINLQFILYQLLVRNGYKCRREEFTITSTFDTQLKHDRELQIIFDELRWAYSPL